LLLTSFARAATKHESSPDRLQDVEIIEPEQPSTSAQEAVNEEVSSLVPPSHTF
jgi:hypothetical protein